MSIMFKGFARRPRLERIVEDLVGEVATLRDRLADCEARQSAVDRLAGEVRMIGQRLDAELEKFSALARDVAALDRTIDASERSGEDQRRKLFALAKSVDWEMDSLRKSLQVVLPRALAAGERAADIESLEPALPASREA